MGLAGKQVRSAGSWVGAVGLGRDGSLCRDICLCFAHSVLLTFYLL